MHGIERVSCANCWFNGLQQGSLGLSLGYCVEHKVVLRRAEETTCGRHVRNDLTLPSARAQQVAHRRRYSRMEGVQNVRTAEPVDNAGLIEQDTAFLRRDPVGDAVADYGAIGSKIESLALLKGMGTFRGDLALFSLGRSYANRCVGRGGRWTSGLHLLWWARQRLATDPVPDVRPEDLRYTTATSLDRQVDLAQWSILMLRILFISDVGRHAEGQGDGVGRLADFAEQAAEESRTVAARTLARWVKGKGLAAIDAVFPYERYVTLATELHRDPDPGV
jgi:hypothetical protein